MTEQMPRLYIDLPRVLFMVVSWFTTKAMLLSEWYAAQSDYLLVESYQVPSGLNLCSMTINSSWRTGVNLWMHLLHKGLCHKTDSFTFTGYKTEDNKEKTFDSVRRDMNFLTVHRCVKQAMC